MHKNPIVLSRDFCSAIIPLSLERPPTSNLGALTAAVTKLFLRIFPCGSTMVGILFVCLTSCIFSDAGHTMAIFCRGNRGLVNEGECHPGSREHFQIAG